MPTRLHHPPHPARKPNAVTGTRRPISPQYSNDDGGIEISRKWSFSRKDLRSSHQANRDRKLRRKTHLQGEHPEGVHVAFFRDLGVRFSGLWGPHKFWGAATVEARDALIGPYIWARDHEGGTKANDARGSIGTDQDVLLRGSECLGVPEAWYQ